jgi:hypothetical protein
MVVHTCNPITWETEARGSQIGGQPGLHRETLSQNKKKRRGGEIEIIFCVGFSP